MKRCSQFACWHTGMEIMPAGAPCQAIKINNQYMSVKTNKKLTFMYPEY